MARTEKQLAAVASPPTTVPEVVDTAVIDVAGRPVEVQAAVAPTQVRHPWRSTLRTAVQFAFGVLTLLPLILSSVYDDPADVPAALVQMLAFQTALARVMALPAVEALLRRYRVLSWLSAAPAPDDHVIDRTSDELLRAGAVGYQARYPRNTLSRDSDIAARGTGPREPTAGGDRFA